MVISSRSASSAPAGYRFPREVIAVAVRWYLRYGLSCRHVEELLTERGIDVDHVPIHGRVQTFTLQFIDAAHPSRHASGDRWFVDETYVKVTDRWTYLYRAVDQYGQVIDILLSQRRDAPRRGRSSLPRGGSTPLRLRSPPIGCPPTPASSTTTSPPARDMPSSNTPTTSSS